MLDARTAALDLARRGLKVFRTHPTTLTPLQKEFWKHASSNVDEVKQMFTSPTGESVDDNVAILTGDDLLVIDVDMKNGKDGIASLTELCSQGLSHETFTVSTPSGGRHLFYRVDAKVLILKRITVTLTR